MNESLYQQAQDFQAIRGIFSFVPARHKMRRMSDYDPFVRGAFTEAVNELSFEKHGTPPESGGVARSAGVVPKRNPAALRLWNHPSRDRFAITLPS